MNLLRITLIVCLITGTTFAAVDKLPIEQQREVIADYLYVTGQLDSHARQTLGIEDMSDHQWPIKCGMPAVADFFIHRDKLSQRLLQSMSASIAVRPVLSDSVDSPGGNFRIHYTTVGDDAVHQPTIDINPSNGIPDYVDKVAEICDSVYWYTIDTLNYPKPPVDTIVNSGGDEKYDIYILNLPPRVFGFTYPEVAIDPMTAVSYIELDNDYQGISAYYDQNPLDAVRVTIAHEYFHAVHFGLDFTEYEQFVGETRPRMYWMEMSATWMEEQQYDQINDYYGYLPFFFGDPSASMQRARDANDLHQYGSVVFPIFLTEKYTRKIIRDIWLLCRDMGGGPNFLRAADSAMVMASSRDDTANGLPWARHFAEFALWNYFTGSRAALAPPGIGYSERLDWPALAVIPDNKMLTLQSYPQNVPDSVNTVPPFHNAAEYIELQNLITLEYTSYWNCDSIVAVDSCLDSSQVVDTMPGYDFQHTDSTLPIVVDLDRSFLHPWGMSVVYYPKDYPDSVIVEGMLLNCCFPSALDIVDPHQYTKVAIILSPASDQFQQFNLSAPMRLGILAGLTSAEVRDANQLEAVVLSYPNPAVVREMAGDLWFRVSLEAGQLSTFPYVTDAYMTVDIYTTAGDLVSKLAKNLPRPSIADHFDFETPWNMKNRSGRDVASGVYIAFVRLLSAKSNGVLLAEDKVKLLLVR